MPVSQERLGSGYELFVIFDIDSLRMLCLCLLR